MTVGAGNKISGADVVTDFNRLRALQSKYKMTQTAAITSPAGSKITVTSGSTTTTNVINMFRTYLNGLTAANMSNSSAKNPDTALTSPASSPAITQPTAGSKILADTMLNVQKRLTYLETYVTGCSCVSYCSTCCVGYYTSDYSPDYSTCVTCCVGDNGTNSDFWGGTA